MADKRSSRSGSALPRDFPAVEPPEELFPMTNIRFLMSETAKLIERVDGLVRSNEKLSASFDKAMEKHSADTKERLAEIKADIKEIVVKQGEMKETIDSFKGAVKVMNRIYALALVVMGAVLAWYLRPSSPAPSTPAVVAPPAPAVTVTPPK